ncbi:hypothetical protein CT0861_06253 [Colletotrichum tofieldiae]|uniref:Uncharacterized protein n=1 Tax=Colletotrichum tofieldiae TaxID=708197 RepID=A0A166MKQ8_9PEZI|nr:hypothetical protein CT0861_06253 [Colletotrichum tofieldiae]
MVAAMETPAAPYSPLTHPPLIMDKLEVGSLYIMISIPLPIYLGRNKHTYASALPDDPTFPFCTYELMVSDGLSSEEFHWDLYWHTSEPLRRTINPADDEGGGTIYRLRQLNTCPPSYVYDRLNVVRVRSHSRLVGLVRVLSVPASVIPHLTGYLDWITAESAHVAERSYVWATMAYYRTRRHVLKGDGVHDHSFHQFDISRFTAELLSFAYRQVPSALVLGVTLGFLEAEEVAATRRKRNELLRRQREEFGVIAACWYQ